MKSLSQQFTAHPVGQGLFYSCSINIKDDFEHTDIQPFKFVFDCGSLNTTNADEEVTIYRHKNLPNATDLALLVISDFDADHVSHIKKLLNGRKVKKVVLPFAPLEERLFLVLRYISQSGRGRQAGDSPKGFMLDPIGRLGDHLNDDSTIYIVNSREPDKPIDSPGEQVTNVSANLEPGSGNFEFSIPSAEPLPLGDNPFTSIIIQVPGIIVKFDDSRKGFLNYRIYLTAIIKFLFYRSDLGTQNNVYFKAVFNAFLKKYRFKPSASVDELIEVLKGIRGATNMKRIFNDFIKVFPGITPTGRDIVDLNATALFILHFNLKSIYALTLPVPYWDWTISIIKKFDGTNRTRIVEHMCCLHPCLYEELQEEYPFTHFPNCLLTSDNYLKTQGEVNGLYTKYQHYWEHFWLFQLPHHGAAASAGPDLLNRLPTPWLAKFINHGAKK